MKHSFTLTPEVMEQSQRDGRARRQDSKARGCKDRLEKVLPSEAAKLNVDIDSRASELALHLFLKVPLNRLTGGFHEADLGKKIQVRHTRHENGCLILREHDDPNYQYVLVTGTPPKLFICGFAHGNRIKRFGKYTPATEEDGACWMLKQSLLFDISELNKTIDRL